MGKALDTIKNSALGGVSNLVGGIGSGISNQVTDMLFGNSNRKKQLKQQQKLTDMQTAAKRDLMAYEQQLNFKHWQDTNYSAQVEEMKKAGLNTALMYGSAGGGGQSSGTGDVSVTGGQADSNQMGYALQLQHMQSQIELNKALANKEEAQAESISKTTPVEVKKGEEAINLMQSQIDNLFEEKLNKQTYRVALELENSIKSIQTEVLSATKEVNIENAKQSLKYLTEQTLLLEKDNYIKEGTKNAIIQQQNELVKNVVADTLVKNTQGRLNETQAWNLIQRVTMDWQKFTHQQKMDFKNYYQDVNKMQLDYEKWLNDYNLKSDLGQQQIDQNDMKIAIDALKLLGLGLGAKAGIKLPGAVIM